MSLMNEVRQAISNSHNAIEQTGFSIAMMDGSLSPKNYAFGLAQLLHIHQGLETLIASRNEVKNFLNDEMIRTATIIRDLNALGFTTTSLPVLRETKSIVETMSTWAAESPFALLGCLYILEGSRMGSLVIAKPLAKILGLQPGEVAGIEYHVEGASKTPMRVRMLKEQIDNGVKDSHSQESLKQGAVRFMEMLNQLYSALPIQNMEANVSVPKCPFAHASMASQLKSA